MGEVFMLFQALMPMIVGGAETQLRAAPHESPEQPLSISGDSLSFLEAPRVGKTREAKTGSQGNGCQGNEGEGNRGTPDWKVW
jgi:hypothetical protein